MRIAPAISLDLAPNDRIRRASQLTGCVSGPYLASLLSQKLGYTVTRRTVLRSPRLQLHAPQPAVRFPNATDSAERVVVPAQRCSNTFPAPNTAMALPPPPITRPSATTRKGLRLDANTRWGLLSAYYFIDDFNLDNPYPVAQSGASVPGFDALTTGRAQLLALGDTKTLSARR
jgi:hypothetical protein